MTRRLAALSLLLFATPALAQPQPSQAERARISALSAALAQCHHGIVLRDAHSRFTAAQIVDRALAGCARREAPIRAELVRRIGAQNAQGVMQRWRARWRQVIGQMVAQARVGH